MNPADLNILFHASLEFGPNWRRSLVELAAERLPHLALEEREDMAKYIYLVRDAVELYIEELYHSGAPVDAHMERQALRWIQQHYPWMDRHNINHAYRQGIYYALARLSFAG